MTTITILKEDLEKCNYYDARSCPITKALQRAGFKDYRHDGTAITSEGKVILLQENGSELEELDYKVQSMMFDGVEKETFSIDLPI